MSSSNMKNGARGQALDLRLYQTTAIAQVLAAIEAGQRRVLLTAPTGAGKTVIAVAMIDEEVQAGGRVLFLAHRRELIAQAANKLFAAGVTDLGIILAGHPARPDAPVQVASIATLHCRAVRSRKMELPQATLVIVDECQHCPAKSYRAILRAYPDAIIIGLTATPCRGDGRGLGSDFGVLVETPQIAELIDLGFAVETRVYAPATGHNRSALSFRKAKGHGPRGPRPSISKLQRRDADARSKYASFRSRTRAPSESRPRRARSDSVACNPMTAAEPTL